MSKRDLSSIPPLEGERTRSTCLRCDGTGWCVELRVVWKVLRIGKPPLPCYKRVKSRYEAAKVMADLRGRQGITGVDCLSMADLCRCRAGKKRAPKITQDNLTQENVAQENAVLTENPSSPAKTAREQNRADWKARQAGDME